MVCLRPWQPLTPSAFLLGMTDDINSSYDPFEWELVLWAG